MSIKYTLLVFLVLIFGRAQAMEEVRDITTNNFEAMQQAAIEEIKSGYYENLTPNLLPFFANATSSSLSGGRPDVIISLITIAVAHDHKNILRFLKYFGVLERHLFFYLRLPGNPTPHLPACPIELVDLLVQAGANVNYHESFITPIVAAINMRPRNLERTFKLLGLFINAGADVNQISDHTTPLEIAVRKNKDLAVVKYLLFHGADTDLPTKGHILRTACSSYSNNNEIIEFLLSLPETDINYVNQHAYNTYSGYVEQTQCSSLFASVIARQINKVALLLNHGADINIKDPLGWTPLMLASAYGYYEMVQFLLENKADIAAENKEGQTALELAKEWRHNSIIQGNHKQVIKLLKSQESPA